MKEDMIECYHVQSCVGKSEQQYSIMRLWFKWQVEGMQQIILTVDLGRIILWFFLPGLKLAIEEKYLWRE